MTYQTPYIALGALSALLSCFVVLTGLIWPKYMLSKNRPFSTIIFFISFCDFCGSILNCLGFPSNGLACEFQACGYLFFFPASWLWTLMLVYQLRTLIIYNNIRLSVNTMHFICWSIACIPALFPLTTNPYGQDDNLEGNTTCTLGGNIRTKFIWKTVSVSGLAFLCFVLMTFWCVEILKFCYKTGGENSDGSTRRKISLFRSMSLYPLALLVTWVPYFILDMLIAAGVLNTKSISFTTIFVVIGLGTQNGSLLSIIYFSQSSVARSLWVNLLRRNLNFATVVRYRRDDTAAMNLLDVSSVLSIISKATEDDEDVLVLNALSSSESSIHWDRTSAFSGRGSEMFIQMPEL